ncbi:MAG: 16S rRNA (adenine(1518)-N(6)/adenine(1519)-N(6))-dimethyltransferase RsmA [Patescibacteria group bacterium]
MRKLGQHFLKPGRTGSNIINKMLKAAELSKNDLVLEVGPGKGILTKVLLEKSGRVIAVEKDKRLAEYLKEKFKDDKNLEIIEGDILKIQSRLGGTKLKNYKIVANIPYYLTSRFLRTFLQDAKTRPEKMVLMVQKEVGERILAKPPHMNLLAISVQIYGRPKIIAQVSKKHFSPQPKVDSAIILIDNISKNINIERLNFWKIVKTGFSHKRKLLVNNLKSLNFKSPAKKGVFEKCGIKEKARAENLSLENWRCLAEQSSLL